jgi:hypothetical protein
MQVLIDGSSENSAATFTENDSGVKRLDSSAEKLWVRFGGEEATFRL